jgi:hypothetical protein
MQNIELPFFLWSLGMYWYIFRLDEDSPSSMLGMLCSNTNVDFGFETLSIGLK